jgi:tRNA pseudouridine13 synthase
MLLDHARPLPLLTAALSGIGGRIKAAPEEFEVEEVPAYLPSGSGDHLYLWVRKSGMGAEYFVRQVARRLGVPPGEVGTAGMKDRHAVTRQWVSVPASAEASLSKLDGEGITVLEVSRHGNKLRPGHLRGNRFRILIRDVTHPEGLPALVEALRQQGMPNFYGPQRFGRGGETLQLGLGLLEGRGGRVAPFLRRLALSAVQSALFNEYLSARMEDGLLHRAIPGDVMQKWPHGGMFVSQAPAVEQPRLDAGEVVPTGPMFGRKMFPSEGEALSREEAVLARAGIPSSAFQGFGKLLAGTRRYLFVHVPDLAATVEAEGVRLCFTLPAGSYATVLARELTHDSCLSSEDSDE